MSQYDRRPGLVHHVIRAAAYVTIILLRINDVIGCASAVFYVEEAPRDHTSVTVHVQAQLTAISHSSEKAKLSFNRWI